MGTGRLPEPPELLAAFEAALRAGRDLDGLKVLVTAGGTREPIDAVRYVGNRSSGRMGFALAEEAARRGAEVTVVAANVALPRRSGIEYVDVQTAAELAAACEERFDAADVLLMAAAVADYRPDAAHAGKLKKDETAGNSSCVSYVHRTCSPRSLPAAAPASCWSASPPSTATGRSPTGARSSPARTSTPSWSTTSVRPASASTPRRTRLRS